MERHLKVALSLRDRKRERGRTPDPSRRLFVIEGLRSDALPVAERQGYLKQGYLGAYVTYPRFGESQRSISASGICFRFA